MATEQKKGIRPEDERGLISETEITEVGETYTNFYKYKTYRQGLLQHFQNFSFEDMLVYSRRLFWNSMTTDSKDLRELGLDFSIPFARKETMDFLGRITSLGIKPKMTGDSLDLLGMKVLNGMYSKWRFKANDKVEKFWEMLYGLVNGTVASYVGYNNKELQRRYLNSYDPKTGSFDITQKAEKYWDDVCKEIVPIEDMYIPKIYERNFQKQGRVIWKTQMDEYDFHKEYDHVYPNAKYAMAGNRIAEDSLYYRLLGGSGTTSYNKIEILREYDWLDDKYKMVSNGMLLNHLGTNNKPVIAPMPFDHKMGPFVWGVTSPLDEKIAYGLPTPFLVKDPHKILNVMTTMAVERELRAVDPVILSSDIESPEFVYGQHKVIPVNDINAYKEFKLAEPSNQYFNIMNSMQTNMRDQAQGGDSKIIPSRQPKSAREVSDNSNDQQESMANTVVMYYDMIRQEILLVLKTMFQFYTLEKYQDADKNVYRNITVPDMPLSLGGSGNLKIRLVKKKKHDMDLFIEAIKESALNGKETEIVEVPIEWIQNVEFDITKIELEPDNSDDIELANFVENVISPLVNIYIPAGVADIHKTFLRHMEKMGEYAADYASEGTPQGAPQAQPAQPLPPGQQAAGQTRGNLLQSVTGMRFGGQNNKGLLKK